jgi:signal transduction histidine kinase
MAAAACSTQQLAEFVAAVSAAESETSAALTSVERAAEALDADVAAIVGGGDVLAAVGYPAGTAPLDALEAVKPGVEGASLEVPGIGMCTAAAASLEHPPGATLVVARPGPDGLTRAEIGLLRGMARVASLTMRMLRVRDEERAAREELEELASEQAALRRVATLVAEATAPEDVFSAVAEEVAQLTQAEAATVFRYEDDGTATVVGGHGDPVRHLPIGARLAVAGEHAISVSVLRTGRLARTARFSGPPGSIADAFRRAGMQTGTGSPIILERRLWGVVIAARARPEPLTPEDERRIPAFTELVATAIANAQARVALRAIADEQAALRRVATLVARAARPPEVFAAVTEELGRLLSPDVTLLGRYDADETVTLVAAWRATGDDSRVPVEVPARFDGGPQGVTGLVRETGRPARIDRYRGPAAEVAFELGIRSAVAAPITVEGRLWGVMSVASTGDQPPPPGTESRLVGFAELVATAIANAEAHAELTASRARIATTADETRRRIGRDLHDGSQQRLVALALQLRAAQKAVPPPLRQLAADLGTVATGLTDALEELREFARGIHPAILTAGGLEPALRTLAARSAVPIDLDVRVARRPPEPIEVGAYYVVSEALANAAKHADASVVAVEAEAVDGVLRISVRDDGVGGAGFAHGSGLVGLKDRVEALGGRIELVSPRGAGTSVEVELPLTP